jgi:hypothetical protein
MKIIDGHLRRESNPDDELRRLVPEFRQDEGVKGIARSFAAVVPGLLARNRT